METTGLQVSGSVRKKEAVAGHSSERSSSLPEGCPWREVGGLSGGTDLSFFSLYRMSGEYPNAVSICKYPLALCCALAYLTRFESLLFYNTKRKQDSPREFQRRTDRGSFRKPRMQEQHSLGESTQHP